MDISYAEIVEELKNHAEGIAFDLLQSPKVTGARVYGHCHGKCSVVIKGGETGLCGFWNGQRDKQGGNLIHLIEIAMGMNHGEAVRYAKSHYLGMPDREFTEEEKREWAKRKREQEAKQKQREAVAEKVREKKVDDVRSIWSACQPVIDTPASAYLNRRIERHDWPASLKFHRHLLCEMDKRHHPALVAAVQGPDRALIALWRIFLNPDGTNLIIDGQKVKMGFGPASGGLVRLTPATGNLRVGEGLESTLGAMALNKWQGAWACSLSTSGMRGFKHIEGITGYTLYSDADYARFERGGDRLLDSPGMSAAKTKQEEIQSQGLSCGVMDPPEGMDWLDVWEAQREQSGN